VKTYRKFLSIICLFIAGCAVGGFDITQPLVKLRPEPTEKPIQRVDWIDYNDEAVRQLPQTADRCILFYFKRELGCWECDALDKSFTDDAVATLANQHFINIIATDDMEDFERGKHRMGVTDIPHVFIMKPEPPKLLASHSGPIKTRALIDIIFSTLGECYQYDRDN